ncbi:hypothetical protein Fcan01_28556 [Folsomia candida]|uniref:Uncharacterized protein n=1 Tax=Folsomia candida TaxID=158441 RepID=A0A226CT73_FOLCA|nr:hypothetical protein Fcan01_28556 [Folsomia candida]
MLPYFGKLSTTSVPYLDLYVGLNEINVTLHVVMFETSKRPVLEGNEIDTSTSCLSYGPVFHTDLTPTNLLHLAKLCYVRTLTPVGNYGDEGLSDDLYGEIDLADPDELVAKAVDELPRKVGGVLGIRDIINIGIGTHDERYLPFFTLMVDYEDYTGTTQTSKVCLLLSTTLDFLFENELESEIWDCRPLCVYSDVAGFSNFRFDDANDSDLIEDVWNCLRGKMLDDPVGWLEDVKTLESLKRPDVLQENYGDETVPPSSELTINEVQLEWRSCEKGANYLNMVVQVEVFGGQGDDVKRKMSIHAAIIELGVPLKSSDLENFMILKTRRNNEYSLYKPSDILRPPASAYSGLRLATRTPASAYSGLQKKSRTPASGGRSTYSKPGILLSMRSEILRTPASVLRPPAGHVYSGLRVLRPPAGHVYSGLRVLRPPEKAAYSGLRRPGYVLQARSTPIYAVYWASNTQNR